MWRGIKSFRGWVKKFGIVLMREASAARWLPVRHFTSVAGSSRARSSSYREHFVNAAEPAWNVPCPWHGHSCRGSPRQRDATSLRIHDVPPPCCVRLSWCFLIASRRMSAPEHMVPLRGIHNPAMVVKQIKVVKGTPSCFRCCGTSRLNVHTSTLLGINPLVVHRVDQLAGAARGARRIRVPFPSRFLRSPYFIR
jgi:hypothetical protein